MLSSWCSRRRLRVARTRRIDQPAAWLLLCLCVALPALAIAADPGGTGQSNGYEDDPAKHPAVRRMLSSLAILMLSALLVLILTIGAYLMIRVGRKVAKKPPHAGATAYVDAWSSYRVSDDQIDAAMRDLKSEHGVDDEAPPDDEDDRDRPSKPNPSRDD